MEHKLKDIIDSINKKENINVSTVGIGEGLYLISKNSNFSVVLTDNIDEIDNMKIQLEAFNKKVCIFKPFFQTPFYVDSLKSVDFLNTLNNFKKLLDDECDTLLIDVRVLNENYPKCILKDNFFNHLKKGFNYDLTQLIQQLIIKNYTKVDVVENAGQFSVRGDILDIQNLSDDFVTRINFFDTLIEKIIRLNEQKSEVNEIIIVPNSLYVLDENEKKLIINELKSFKKYKNLKLNEQDTLNQTIEIIEYNLINKHFSNAMAWLKPLIPTFNLFKLIEHKKPNLYFFDYSSCLVALENDKFLKNEQFLKYKDTGQILPKQESYIDIDFKKFNIINFSQFYEKKLNFKTYNIISNKIENYRNKTESLIYDAQEYINHENQVVIACEIESELTYLTQVFSKKIIKYKEIKNIEEDKYSLNFFKKYLPYGFKIDNLVIMPYGKKKKSDFEVNKKQIFVDLPKIGDYVVHNFHGIGVCLGTQKIQVSGFYKDYVVIQYDGTDKLYLPVENLDSISRYIGDENPKLNKLGGAEFSRAKNRVRAQLKDVALEMIKVYAEREKSRGKVYEVDTFIQKEFKNSFAYDETADQLKAIEDVENDLKSGKIMDRLICGDVGYGKTEVAFRSAMIVIENGSQVALLCPTTVLSMQHFKSALSRFKDFGVKIAVVNRFKTGKEIQEIQKKLANKDIDLIIGTQKLLNPSFKFNDLGLLILDEEQKLGVKDKEKIKQIKHNINVLAMSATPIPRTLHMSLVKIRDISIIATPPKLRKSVDSIVSEFSNDLICNAIQQELNRGGQVLVIYNRVEDICKVTSLIKGFFKDANVQFAHGQMEKKSLENVMINMFNGETDILVATTLIENGIDLPNANTMIIIDADKFGLSQLYQLRGRVGRSDRQAYAYFLFNNFKTISTEGKKRLQAISEYTELGSGFKIAMRDLEIRGAGTVLGEKQSGHIEKVGYDMYCKLLAEAISFFQGKEMQEDEKDLQVSINISADIPEMFIENEENRFKAYDQISQIDSLNSLKNCEQSFIELYGLLPKRVTNLMYLALIKNLGKKLHLKNIKIKECNIYLDFYETINENLVKHCTKLKLYDVIKNNEKSILLKDNSEIQNEILKFARVLNDL